MGIIEKARANVPAKPAKKAAKKPAPVAAALPPKQEVRDEDDEEVESIISAACKSTPAAKVKSKGGVSKAKAPPPSSKKKKEEEDSTPAIITNVSKEQRLKEEKALKTLKWNFSEPRAEFLEQLKLQMERNFNKAVMAQLFHADFKQHIKAIESLMKLLENNLEGTAANLDLLLRWMTLRFFDTNPSMLNKALEYLINLFTALAEMDYRMTDSEAGSFIPYLVNKVGDPKDNVRREVRTIFKLICKVYPASKMFSFIIDGLKAKNAKLRTECLEELGCLIEYYGVNVCQPSPAQALKLIAQQIGDRDNCVRSAALNSLVSAHHILGEQTYKYIGRLKDKDQSLLEERIKRSAKNKPPQTPQPTHPSKSNRDRPKNGAPLTDKGDSATVRNPKSAPTPSRPIKKIEFSLEVEEVDLKEVDLNLADLDYISNILAEKVELPKTNTPRPCSPSTFVDLLTNDASSAIGLVISDIASTDTLSSIQALAQINEVLKDKEKRELMVNHIDKLLLTLSMQLKMVYSKHMADEMTLQEDVMKLYRCLLGTVLDVFQHKNLGRQASRDILKDLLSNLVTNLLVKRLETLKDGPQVIKTVHVAIVKMVRNSDPTIIIGAVIKLLHECLGSETCSTRFIDIVTKCLWKVIRLMPEFIAEINLDRLLLDAHTFLKAYPSSYWKERSSDIQYRTVKTIIHTTYTLVGSKLLDHTSLIGQGDSEVITYIKSLANRNDVRVVSNTSQNDSMNASVENMSTSKQGQSSRKVLESSNEILLESLSKISSEEKSEEGLNDLYDFMKKHPEVDLDSFLQKYSQSFQLHVQKGLKVLEQDKEVKHNTGSKVLRDSSPNPVCDSRVISGENVLMNSSVENVVGDSNWLPISDSAIKTAISYREKLCQLRTQRGQGQACEGLDALIEFKNKRGQADLVSFLKKSAESFSHYVERDLKAVQQEGESKHRPGNLLKDSNSLSLIDSEKNTAVFFQEKLRNLRNKCGLDQMHEQQENQEPQEPSPSLPKKTSPVKIVPVVKPPEPKPEESMGTVESVGMTSANMRALKKRLDRIKKMAKH